MKNEILIIANGTELEYNKARSIADRSNIIIAADGGALFCQDVGIKPDYIVGDLDSIPSVLRSVFPGTKFVPLPDQELTDLQKTLQFSLQFNPERIRIINSQGGRTDHAAINLLIFQSFSQPQLLEILDDYGSMQLLLPGKHHFNCQSENTVSFFSLGPIRDLTLNGFQFHLKHRSFSTSFIGLSNRTVTTECSISFSAGKLFCYWLDPL